MQGGLPWWSTNLRSLGISISKYLLEKEGLLTVELERITSL
jgi:hypothetical protein